MVRSAAERAGRWRRVPFTSESGLSCSNLSRRFDDRNVFSLTTLGPYRLDFAVLRKIAIERPGRGGILLGMGGKVPDVDGVAQARKVLSDVLSGELPNGEFDHRSHLLVGWYLIRSKPLTDAIATMRRTLFLATNLAGEPERFHETLTWLWMIVIAERYEQRGIDESFDQFLERNPDLLDARALVLRYYDEAVFDSKKARESFTLPRPIRQPGPAKALPEERADAVGQSG